MQPNPIPVFKGDPLVVHVDPLSQAVHDGVKANILAGERRVLEQQVHQLERTLPKTPATPAHRERAFLTAAERRFVSPHRHTAAGARNSAADLALIQKAHDVLCPLAVAAREGSQNDGDRNP